MFKVKNTIAPREFLYKAYHCEGITEHYKEVIRDIMKHNPFAESYYVNESIILSAYQDEERICDEWANKIKTQFRIEKDDGFFEFGEKFELTKLSYPVMIAHGLLEPYEKYKGKCLVVRDTHELIVEKIKDYTILKFKKK